MCDSHCCTFALLGCLFAAAQLAAMFGLLIVTSVLKEHWLSTQGWAGNEENSGVDDVLYSLAHKEFGHFLNIFSPLFGKGRRVHLRVTRPRRHHIATPFSAHFTNHTNYGV